MVNLFYLAVLLPLVGFVINSLFGKKINNEKISGYFSSLMVLIPFLISLWALVTVIQLPEGQQKIPVLLYNWMSAGGINISVSYMIDPLSCVMLLVVTGIGFLIHIYSIGYMHGDKNFALFFSYMNLFIFAMLNLILADNFVLIFLGWEGVGLCSYLLIGFWYEKKFTGEAAKKAFVVNRIGDFGFLTAMFLIFRNFGTLNVDAFLVQLSGGGYALNNGILITIGLLLFLAATGKSAQIPLFVWLPDAMAGPTPVSALIHAATMVTAGVYLIARTSLLYSLLPVVNVIIFAIGLFTALMSASIALKQNDFKKVLAYSTISQLGFMFMALGAHAYVIAIFHLVTHAFFKALLFLGSGSVIHSMHDEQDIRNMGNVKKYMKITFITFFIGTLAISGIPPLSGFFSKDEILFNSFLSYGIIPYIIVLFIAALTAIYMVRLLSLVFYGEERFDKNSLHPHESPATMTIPLMVLAVLSVIGGFIGFPHYLGLPNYLEEFLHPVFNSANLIYALPGNEHSVSMSVEIMLVIVSIIVAVGAVIYSFRKYTKIKEFREEKGFSKVLENKYYVDEGYDKAVVQPIYESSDKFLWKIVDMKIIDGFINGTSNYFQRLSLFWRKLQTGVIQDYTAIAVAGIAVIILFLMFTM
jgi:NADH-quinone oxidoreductase subunit L